MPAFLRTSGVTSFWSSSAMRSRFTMVYSTRKMLLKPRLGRRRCSGIWPPSKPRIMREPERDLWPLWPRVEVLPMPEPIPRPTRLRFSLALRGALMVERFVAICVFSQIFLLNYFDQVRHLAYHAANGGRILPLNHLVQPRESQAAHHFFVLLGSTNCRAHP